MKTEEKHPYPVRVTDKQRQKIKSLSDELKTTTGNAIEIAIDHYIKLMKAKPKKQLIYSNNEGKIKDEIQRVVKQEVHQSKEIARLTELLKQLSETDYIKYLEKTKGIDLFKDKDNKEVKTEKETELNN